MSFEIGDLVVFNTHPYTETYFNIKVVGYSEYTPPIMVVYEVHNKNPKGIFVECIYYDSKGGKYVIKHIKSEDLKVLNYPNSLGDLVGDEKIGFVNRKKMLMEIDFVQQMRELDVNFTDIGVKEFVETEYFHKRVALKSVDLELHKHKINREKVNGELVETNHLEFLPPIMTIIGFRFINETKRFSTDTGKPLIEFKCKWYNSISKTYSEEFFKAEVFYEIKQQSLVDDVLDYYINQKDSNSYNLVSLDSNFELEDTDITIKYKLIQVEEILFKHYFYQAFVNNLVENKKESVLIQDKPLEVSENQLFGAKYPDYRSSLGKSIYDYKFEIDEYYSIAYSDKFNRLTKRIVYVRSSFIVIVNHKDLFDSLGLKKVSTKDNRLKRFLNESTTFYFKRGLRGMLHLSLDEGEKTTCFIDEKILFNKNVNVFIETNCLLKKGKIRYFRLDSIYSVKKIENGNELFEDGIVKEVI